MVVNQEDLLASRPTRMFADENNLEARTLAKFLAKYFIARTDVKAVQRTDILGAYAPVKSPWTLVDFFNHFSFHNTYGHYLLDTDSTCKIFAYDIDFKKTGELPTIPIPEYEEDMDKWYASFQETNLREAWMDRSHVARTWMKIALRETAAKLASACTEFEVPHLISYTGAKGLHVYGLIGNTGDYTGRAPAEDVYAAAHLILESTGEFELSKGKVFYQGVDPSNIELNLFEIEVFPKQTEITEDGYGNLLRLPYGVNLKAPKDRTFFIDETLPYSRIEPASIGQILSSVNI